MPIDWDMRSGFLQRSAHRRLTLFSRWAISRTKGSKGEKVAIKFLNRFKPEIEAIETGTPGHAGPLVRSLGRFGLFIAGAVFAMALMVVSMMRNDQAGTPAGPVSSAPATAFSPPDPAQIPQGPGGDSIRRGLAIFENTGLHAADYVGNSMACKNCHLDSGRRADSSPMWAAWVSYPQFRKKNASINTMEDRIMGCFRYSMNAPASPSGGPPPAGSDVYRDLQSYFQWLATGAPTGERMPGAGFPMLKLTSAGYDPGRGAPLYDQHCSGCHGPQGEGAIQQDGTVIYPPLWGNESYNWGAGMARVDLAAAFIKANMPLDDPGKLSEQEAWDIAAYVDSQERPRDPRQTGSIAANAAANFKGQHSFYGQRVAGKLLGTGSGAQ